ncbi:EcoKI restriction-modification system protein HsdS [Citrobacter werkmanii]|uniref:EcoKI restriction-modification system protein HsdS n=1 Tax=Citrobacter werkmanii TaxID=67827 RepID=A0A9N8GXT6_9ENTR|nr:MULTISPECIES: restriction endonuclease subunit S [Citrobacter]MBQ4922648.1 restriction endonuclease subunit S [Citrobacter werkmanii]MBQ4935936.1 restriction endonuclease subunit S [Citrobacter werkmanii]MBQ4948040.1 restriction endonuclease subunit S [Citrobacter werkmanii]MBQ4964434.1 restriction endonuclease subunit S [Citrobacter werkmanii]MDM3294905.1 restriction endonuclease subunit S [Citrobacter sp. Cc139]
MGSKWKTVRLGDYCIKIGSGATPKGGNSVYTDTGNTYFIRSQNVYNNGFNTNGLVFITDEAAFKLKNVNVQENDVLLNITGDSVARVCIAPGAFLPARVNQHVAIIRPKNDAFDPRFLRYFLSSPHQQTLLLTLASAGATRNALTKGMIEDLQVPKPPVYAQKSIANVLDSFDKKIESNNKINQTLEQMSQTLFKSWFVDFDPVIDNALDAGNPIPEALQSRAELRQKVRNSADFKPLPADIRALFPAEFEETELTYAPKGWVTNRLENILELAYGKALKKTERTNGDYPVYGSGGVDGTHNEYLVKGPGIIVGRKGTVGSLHWENKDFYPIDTVFFVKPKEYFPLVYCYQLLKTLGLENMNTDAAVPGLNRNNAYRLEVVTPTQPIIAKFTNIIQAIQFKIDSNHNETENLTALRDTLLPKLISGELSLEDLPDLVTQTEPA